MKAILRSIRISPKKVNLVADMVRGKPVQWAIDFLKFVPKRSAKPLMETIKSAVANAVQNFKQNKRDLYLEKIIVNGGATLKRSRCVSRGRSHPIMKRTSHITVEVGVSAPAPEKATSKKSAKASTSSSSSTPTTK
ncbi:50S ribosomal protein L22 [Candidatus Gracilibacteria bacterium]|nr:50S ribosomal protein L22 [Candidatus Gracilibacteria bacterium]